MSLPKMTGQSSLNRSRIFYRRMATALLLLIACTSQPGRTADSVINVVRQFLEHETRQLGQDVKIEVIVPLARFPACPQPQPYLPGKARRHWGLVTVGIRCGDTGGAQRYLQARVSVSVPYWVTAQTVPANTPLDVSLLEQRIGNLGDLPRQVIRQVADLDGQVTSRPLVEGTILQESLLRTPPLVERRQEVSVEARGSGFQIARQGQALDAGGKGEQVRVRLPNRDTLRTKVIGPGRVTVNW